MARESRREPRVPLFVKVLTEPGLPECWSVNLSSSGIGLIAAPPRSRTSVPEGGVLDLELQLPDTGIQVRARGHVAWLHRGVIEGQPVGTVSLGVRFDDVSHAHRLALAQYVRAYRFQVAVVFADKEERLHVKRSLGSETELHYADTLAALERLCERGDIAAVLLMGHDAGQLERTLTWASETVAQAPSGSLRPRDFAPRLICCVQAPAELLLRFVGHGLLFRVLSRPVDTAALAEAALEACRDYGMHTEQRRVAFALERALRRERARSRPPTGRPRGRPGVVGESAALQRLLELIDAAAQHRISVLLQGETGTGKEVLARALHEASERAESIFVVQDCGALTETLLESELFGHVKGAFTGADSDHVGLFVLADGGTIFLDEIGTTSPKLQAKLLRVIETGEVRPVGSTRVRTVDVRVIAASNRDLAAEVQAGRMRGDLYYRLSSFPIHVPPLRERRDDILPLARHFITEMSATLNREPLPLGPEAEAVLLAHDWPGNARELRNVIERAMVLTRPDAAMIETASLPDDLTRNRVNIVKRGGARTGSLKAQLEQVEREIIREVLQAHGWVIRRAAETLGVDPSTLSRKARRYGLED